MIYVIIIVVATGSEANDNTPLAESVANVEHCFARYYEDRSGKRAILICRKPLSQD